jgi:hypothetical protein
MASRPERVTLPLRIVVDNPVPGVALALRSGRFDLIMPTSVTATAVTFDLSVEASQSTPDGPVVCYGPFTQGPPTGRFVYITVGTRAGQLNSPWERRAKIPLTGITPALVDRATAQPGSVLEVSFGGRGRDGSPVCATIKLPADAWQLRPLATGHPA